MKHEHTRVIRWTQRHRTLARLIPFHILDRLVWRELENDPTFVQHMAEADADMAAGRWYAWDSASGTTKPNPEWPTYGPQPTHR